MIEKLSGPASSGQYEEIIFDLPGPWKTGKWNYVIFTKKDDTQWCGCFREQDNPSFEIAELPEKNIACIISGGHGYIVDVENKKKIKSLSIERITDVLADEKEGIFYIARWYDLHYVDNNLAEVPIALSFAADGILFKSANNRSVNLEVTEIGAELSINNNYYLDLDKKGVLEQGHNFLSKFLKWIRKN
ncbi:hypothetical protein A9Q91_00735 [Candidatus Gracilibacteria bacterium 28_42_T64]|nr:hypothetical protein A9Q91_00735 [Candidatus Gracilibacteria bacterium 28_42_T64]